MRKMHAQINSTPALIWGEASSDLYLYIHGLNGHKEEAEAFAEIAAAQGIQVLSIDLPEHGERKADRIELVPWNVVPELHAVIKYAQSHWNCVSLRAESIGAWFSMQSFAKEDIKHCMFVSPIIDMQQIIRSMMLHARVSEERLRLEQTIPTDFGQTLSWEYFSYAEKNPVTDWPFSTEIIYGSNDHFTGPEAMKSFSERFFCRLTVMDGGEHWFHTEEQLEFLSQWTREAISTRLQTE